jgi:tRNA A-37 threonylcarbamoyl transferase component Bud32
MPLRITASRPDPAILGLPWSTPLEDWPAELVVPLPRGLSRHVVRIVRLGAKTYAVKETQEPIAQREYRLLRDLQRMGMPSVVPQGVIAGRTSTDGEELPAALLTEHLKFSLPYRTLFTHGLQPEEVTKLIDALVVLMVRLHLAGFFWGDVSLSNVLFRRSAGDFAAYLVDAETGELHESVGQRMREHDIQVGCENIFAEIMDLSASDAVPRPIDSHAVINHLRDRYDVLWRELTDVEEFGASEMWRIEKRIERLNDLGFDVDELDIVTDLGGDTIRIQPKVVELGHHRRELQALTGINVEDNQARRLLNDMAAFTAHYDLGREDRQLVASRWLREIYEPIVRMIPADARTKLEPAEVFHEILVHRWYLSEAAGHEVDIFETARDYFAHVLTRKPDEVITAEA